MFDKKGNTKGKKSINENDYLARLNMDGAPRDIRMKWLCKMIDNEMAKKVDEIDMDLINECREELAELRAEEREERAAGQASQEPAASEYAGNLVSRGRTNAKGHTAWYRNRKKLVALTAAVVVILASLGSVSIVARTQGYASAFEYVSVKANELFNSDKGAVVEEGNITVVHNGKTESYSSVKAFINEEGLDIMYPGNLPDELAIKEIVVADLEEGKGYVDFVFNDTETSLLINNYYLIKQEILENNNYTILNAGCCVFYVIEKDATYQAVCHKESKEYIINTDNYDYLVALINSFCGEKS